jgi:hypothetical protein
MVVVVTNTAEPPGADTPDGSSEPRLTRRRDPLESDATGIPAGRKQALAQALATAHDTLAAKIALLEAEQAAGTMTAAQVAEQAWAAQVEYDRVRALAEIQAGTGWETWAGVGGVLYARRPRTSPPKVVRAADAAGLRQQIEAAQ